MDVVDFYTQILTSLGCVFDDEGKVSTKLSDGKTKPVLVEKRRLVIPTRDALKELPNNDSLQGFHPMCESTLRGESPVLRRLRSITSARTNTMIATLMLEMTALAADRENHNKLTMDQNEFLDVMPDANKKTFKAVTSLINAVSKSRKSITTTYLKRGDTIKGTGYNRVAVTRCNLHAALVSDDEKPYNVTMSKKDRKAITALLEYIIPDLADSEDSIVTTGSKSLLAPYFQALILGFVEYTATMNKIIWKLRKHIEDYKAIYSKLDKETLANLKDLVVFRDQIPPIPGNEGVAQQDSSDYDDSGSSTRASKMSALDALSEKATEDVSVASDEDTPPWDDKPRAASSRFGGSRRGATQERMGESSGRRTPSRQHVEEPKSDVVSWKELTRQKEEVEPRGRFLSGGGRFAEERPAMGMGMGNRRQPAPRQRVGGGWDEAGSWSDRGFGRQTRDNRRSPQRASFGSGGNSFTGSAF